MSSGGGGAGGGMEGIFGEDGVLGKIPVIGPLLGGIFGRLLGFGEDEKLPRAPSPMDPRIQEALMYRRRALANERGQLDTFMINAAGVPLSDTPNAGVQLLGG